uniref:Serpentine receptor class gamma n=1 Tax=Parastrongyloides trichosuri TaxID=131310 RepID=A0A0N4Z013_PARTI
MIITVFDIIRFTIFIPSLFLMAFALIIMISNFFRLNSKFCNEFYPFVAFRIFNDLMYNILSFIMLKLPLYGIFGNFFLENDWVSSIAFLTGASFIGAIFIHALVLSIIRYIAVKYPTKYRTIFDLKKIVILIVGMFLFCWSIGIGTLFFPSYYMYHNQSQAIVLTYRTNDIAYYTFSYGVVIFGVTLILSFIFNVANWISIYRRSKKHRKGKHKKDITYAIYTCFSFIMALMYHGYYILRTIGSYTDKDIYTTIANISLSYIGDVATLGDFYFVMMISKDLRTLMKKYVVNLFFVRCCFERNNQIKTIKEPANISLSRFNNKNKEFY